jgi:hypothetical protein
MDVKIELPKQCVEFQSVQDGAGPLRPPFAVLTMLVPEEFDENGPPLDEAAVDGPHWIVKGAMEGFKPVEEMEFHLLPEVALNDQKLYTYWQNFSEKYKPLLEPDLPLPDEPTYLPRESQ